MHRIAPKSPVDHYKVGYDAGFYPFTFYYCDKPQGSLIEITQMAFELIGASIHFLPFAMGNIEQLITTNEIDAFMGAAVTDDRAHRLSFSVPLVTTGGALFPLNSATQSIKNGESIQEIATPSHGPLVSVINAKFPHSKVRQTTDYRSAMEAVIAGAADAAALNFHAGKVLARREFPDMFVIPDAPFCDLSLALATGLSDSGNLIGRFNEAIHALRGQGAVAKIIGSYCQ